MIKLSDLLTSGSGVTLTGAQTISDKTLIDSIFKGNLTVNAELTGNLVPAVDLSFNLGSMDNSWQELHLSNAVVTVDTSDNILVNGSEMPAIADLEILFSQGLK